MNCSSSRSSGAWYITSLMTTAAGAGPHPRTRAGSRAAERRRDMAAPRGQGTARRAEAHPSPVKDPGAIVQRIFGVRWLDTALDGFFLLGRAKKHPKRCQAT